MTTVDLDEMTRLRAKVAALKDRKRQTHRALWQIMDDLDATEEQLALMERRVSLVRSAGHTCDATTGEDGT